MARLNLDQISRKIQLDKSAAKKSQAWLDEKIRYLGNQVSVNSLMSNSARRQDYFLPGQMYMFFYHPKGANELPYYDTFPLVIPFADDGETFTGLNLHYLPPKMRLVLLANLLDFSMDKKLNESTRLKFQWDYVKGVSRYMGVAAAVKKYRKDHMQSQFLKIPGEQWFNAVMLPVERFRVGPNMSFINKNIVWQQSIGKV